jgi:membrane associated rhomboid family serine protease
MFPLRDDNPHFLTPYATYTIIALNALFWVFVQGLGLEPQLSASVCRLGLIPGELLQTVPAGVRFQVGPDSVCVLGGTAAWYTPLTSMFMHGGWMHIIGNMWSLWIFGDNVEDRMGRGGFLLFYLLSGLTAGAVHVVTNPASTVPTVGASGAIAGVMGAYLLLFPHSSVVTLVPVFFFMHVVEIPAVFFLGFWFFLQLFSGTLALAAAGAQAGGVAWWAHIGGFVVGFLWAVPLRRRTAITGRRRRYDDEDW